MISGSCKKEETLQKKRKERIKGRETDLGDEEGIDDTGKEKLTGEGKGVKDLRGLKSCG